MHIFKYSQSSSWIANYRTIWSSNYCLLPKAKDLNITGFVVVLLGFFIWSMHYQLPTLCYPHFLSAAKGQRPKNYLICCCCCSWIFHLIYALLTPTTFLPLYFPLFLYHSSLPSLSLLPPLSHSSLPLSLPIYTYLPTYLSL